MIYILDSYCISPQPSHMGDLNQVDPVILSINQCLAMEPSYQGKIPNSLLRRMGKAVRMGVGAGLSLLKEHEVDGIIVGTGNGGLEDCVKFLTQIIDWEEGRLTPTNFVQSTANASAGTLALLSKNNSYNTTHVHKGLSFDNALLDALMRIEEGHGKNLLVGAVEELSQYNFNIEWQGGRFKANTEDVDSNNILQSETPGGFCGEGSCFFVFSSDQPSKEKGSVGIDWTAQYNGEVSDPCDWINSVLKQHKINANEIDAVIDGRSGDINTLPLYQMFTDLFPEAAQYAYKHLVGEYPSSSAFATWLGNQVLTTEVPSIYQLNEKAKQANNVLIYNSYLGRQHGLIYMKKV